jgi:diaminohydroxyphosphoribosylaminopyrimidine deaminase/5-amino-6-(5-phosphoribosylamino)uracil reductase
MTDKIFIRRCFELARLGAGFVSPNPMVGAVLVHEGRVIGEGWHQQVGKAHAEVNCLASVRPEDLHLVEKSTLYVSLEPCCTHGRTPPCTDLVLRHRIPRVVVAALDATAEVSGKGLAILREAGVEVSICDAGVPLPSDFRNRFVTMGRPFVTLKFARSADGYMGRPSEQVWLTNQFSQVLAHKCRAAHDAILVGTGTALTDDPSLTTRRWPGRSPLRIVLDRQRKVPATARLFNGQAPTWAVCEAKLPTDLPKENLRFVELSFDVNLLPKLLRALCEANVTSLMVEGGAQTLQGFIEAGFWDEAVVFTAPQLLGNGLAAPTPFGKIIGQWHLANDTLTILRNDAALPLNFV